MDDKNALPSRKVTITKAEIRSGKDAGVYVTLSGGETRMIAETVEFKGENFSEVKTFREVFISPNK